MEKKILYKALVLEPSEQRKLYEYMETLIPKGWYTYCHHMTIVFGDPKDKDEVDIFVDENEGKEFEMNVTHIGDSDKCIAVMVETNVPSKNKIKHITVATSPDGKPYESNLITNWKTVNKPLKLTGVVKKITN